MTASPAPSLPDDLSAVSDEDLDVRIAQARADEDLVRSMLADGSASAEQHEKELATFQRLRAEALGRGWRVAGIHSEWSD